MIGCVQLTRRCRVFRRVFLWICIGLLSACTLTDSPPTLTPTPDLPSVSFQFPENRSQVFEGTDLTLDLVARDNTQGIARIELLVDTQPLQEATPIGGEAVPVFRVEMNWLAQGIGNHILTATAYRADGTPSDETNIVLEVIPRSAPSP